MESTILEYKAELLTKLRHPEIRHSKSKDITTKERQKTIEGTKAKRAKLQRMESMNAKGEWKRQRSPPFLKCLKGTVFREGLIGCLLR